MWIPATLARFTKFLITGFASLGLVIALAPALAAPPETGLYRLHNHPDGAAAPPLYGLRLDELIDVTSGVHDVFTFDFDHTLSEMWMDYTGSTIRIYGKAFGGRDVDGAYASHTALWDINFLYDVGVTSIPDGGVDDVVVDATQQNFGTISSVLATRYLEDEKAPIHTRSILATKAVSVIEVLLGYRVGVG